MRIHSDIFGIRMSTVRVFVIMLFTFLAGTVFGQATDASGRGDVSVKDLRQGWMVQDHNQYQKFEGSAVKTVYFMLDANSSKGDFLRVSDDEPFGIFINQKTSPAPMIVF